jgi:hypothetical protein
MLFQGEPPWKDSASSHRAFAYFDEFRKNWQVIHSTGKEGVNEDSFEEFEKHYLFVKWIPIDIKINSGMFYIWRNNILGRKYDGLQLFGLFLKLIGFITFNSLGGNFRRMTCNEVFLSFCSQVLDQEVGDPDDWDMLMTDALADKIANGGLAQ